MFRKSSILTVLLTLFIFMEVKAQTTTTINASGVNSIVRYKDAQNQNTFQYTSLYQIGRKDGSNGYYSGSTEDIYRSQHSFSLGSIPSNATLSQVKLIYYASGSSSYKFMVTQTSGSQSWGNLWSEIGTASALESDINYGSSSRISSSLLSAVNSARSSGVIYLGALSQNESTNLTEATVVLRLEVTFTVPPAQVNITAQNNFGSGTIKVGVNASATQKTSPYPFTAVVGNTVNLEAQEQSSGGYNMIWNDTEAPANPSKWEKVVDINRTQVSTSISHSFTAASNDNNSTYEAGLRKICNLTFSNPGHSITLNGNNYTSSASSSTVEQNTVTASAEGYFVTDGIEHMFLGGWRNSANQLISSTIITATQNDTYTAEYLVQAINPSISFGTTIGQPVQISWIDNPNTSVTQYRVHRRVFSNGSWSSDEVIGTVNSGVQSFTDYDYNLGIWKEDILVEYGLTAYYSVNNSWSTGGASTRIYCTFTSMQNNDLTMQQTEIEVPTEYQIGNYPNPFNPTTIINYQLPENSFVTIKVYDILGKEIATLVNESKSAGFHNVNFDASRLTSGIYIYTINAGKYTQSKKMLLTK